MPRSSQFCATVNDNSQENRSIQVLRCLGRQAMCEMKSRYSDQVQSKKYIQIAENALIKTSNLTIKPIVSRQKQ